jgi:UDP-N-acetylmuramoyl-L-alanyl-D-glutamate--2,6-diaminopimelate ligase
MPITSDSPTHQKETLVHSRPILGALLPALPLSRANAGLRVTGITADSRQIKDGFVFVAYSGEAQDGHQYIEKAQDAGAVAIVGEKAPPKNLKTPYIQVLDGRATLADMASIFYDHPSRTMCMVGVTGTSGKTTTTYLIESILKAAGFQVGVIGTVNSRFGDLIFPSSHTTPGPVELQQLLHQMREKGCNAVVMEVSSHALKQKRVRGVAFDGMLFTNLSPEHLDYHPDMEDYFRAKELLFTDYAAASIRVGKNPVGVVNTDDIYGKRLFESLQERQVQSGTKIKIDQFRGSEELNIELRGITGTARGIFIQSKLTGKFNADNIMGAIRLAENLGITPQAIQNGISSLQGVPGRLERVENSKGVNVWVDYAHKPDALEKVLKTLARLKSTGKLIMVFGCGGDRDRSKRPVMGRIAVENSDYVWITSDNPRTEAPDAIIGEITTGTLGFNNFSVEVDRRKALFKAAEMAQSGDLLLIAGKGHEDYQILGTQKIPFDDRKIVAEAFGLQVES